MREIKFRVWDNEDYMSSPFTLRDLQEGKIKFTSDCIVMQFTGLHDKNGEEIYEGDIIEWIDRFWRVHADTTHGLRFLYEKDQITKGVASSCEVVGNPYEPLEKEEE